MKMDKKKVLLIVCAVIAILLAFYVGYRMSTDKTKNNKNHHKKGKKIIVVKPSETNNYETNNYYTYKGDDTVSVESNAVDDTTTVEDNSEPANEDDSNLHVACKRGVIEGKYNSAGRGCCVVSKNNDRKGMCCRRVNRTGECLKWTN